MPGADPARSSRFRLRPRRPAPPLPHPPSGAGPGGVRRSGVRRGGARPLGLRLLALGLVALLGAAASGSADGPSRPVADETAPLPPPLRSVTASPAADFVDSVGVNTHFGYGNTAYADTDRVLALLSDLGVEHVRDSFPLRPSPALVNGLAALPARGIEANVVVGSAGVPGPALPPVPAALAPALDPGPRAAIGSIEAPNEWDLRAEARWKQVLPPFQRELYPAVRAGLPSTTVLGPSLGRRSRLNELNNLRLARDYDVHNLHFYARGAPPEIEIADFAARARRTDPAKPLYVTEAGFHTATRQSDRQPGVSEAAQADYEVRNLLVNFGSGVTRTYLYQLLDETAEPALRDQEEHFGLARSDYSLKPSFEHLRELLRLVGGSGADPAVPAAPAALDIGVPTQVGEEGIGSLLLRRPDGSFQLALWRSGSLYRDGADVVASPPVTVALGQAREVSVAVVDGRETPAQDLGAVRSFSGRLGNDVLLFDLGAATAPGDATGTFTVPADGPPTSAAASSRIPEVLGILGGAGVLVAALVLLRARRRTRPAARVR